MNYSGASMNIDKRIISHLRQHLSNKTRKRFGLSQGRVADESEKVGKPKDETTIQQPEMVTIFTKYTDTGEKVQDGDFYKQFKASTVFPQAQHAETNPDDSKRSGTPVHDGGPITPIHLSSETNKNKPAAVRDGYDIPREESSKLSSRIGNNGHKSLITEVSNMSLASSKLELPALVHRKDPSKYSETLKVKSELSIQVKLPLLNRPTAQEKTGINLSPMMTSVLDGTVHKECQSNKNVIYLYVASGNTDMEAELTFMQERLYPQLRANFRKRGRELRILDFHWGFHDTVSDDHKIPDVIRRAIALTHETHLGINFVILLGQKFGSYFLPPEIPKAEFESILNAATLYRKIEKQKLRAAMTYIESQAPEGEKITEQDAQNTDHVITNEGHETIPVFPSVDNSDDNNSKDISAADDKHLHSLSSNRDHQQLKKLRDAEDQLPDTRSLREWYVLDENAMPPVYRLQNISTVYKDILRNDAAKRQVAKLSYSAIESRLLKIFKTFAPGAVTNKESLTKYTRSVFDLELHSIIENEMAKEHIACNVRTIDHLMESIDEPTAGDYIDLVSGNSAAVDIDKWTRVEEMKRAMLNGKITEKNVSTHVVDWAAGGIRPANNRTHYLYAERLCKTLFDQIVGCVEVESVENRFTAWKSELFSEVSEHVKKCQESSRGFQGREDILSHIKYYLKADTRRPLVLHGNSGCGKSAILGTVASHVHEWFQSENVIPHVFVRMIGCTDRSRNARTLLKDISLQLCHLFDYSPAEIPRDYNGIANDLECRLGHATKDHPIVIILDGVDILSDDNDGRKLMWLPTELPQYVHFILSTTSDEKCLCLPAVRMLLIDHENSFLEIGQLQEQESLAILTQKLNATNRKLTEQQFKKLCDAVQKCLYPLYVQMAVTEAIRWTSSQSASETKLGETVKTIVTLRFCRLERDHGEILTRRALGYITASRHGLTSNEMEDILSLDEAVMDDILATYKPPRRRLPPLLWSRLKEDMENLITECWADNTRTMTWAHILFYEVAEKRYLSQRDKASSHHKALAEYFSGMLAGKPKPQSNIDKGTDRLVASQELYIKPPDFYEDGWDRIYNLRGLNELPYHLIRCQMTKQLKENCLCNYEWMLARLCGTSYESLLEEYRAILLLESKDNELNILLDTLLLSCRALQQEPRQLASQLVGRLHRIVTADNPKSPGDPKLYPNLHNLLAAVRQSSVPALIPSIECLTEPGGILCDLLSGHNDTITAVTLTSDGKRAVTTSADRTIKLWDVRLKKVVKSIHGVKSEVSAIRTAKLDTLVITIEGSRINIWNIDLGICVHSIVQYVDPPSISVAAGGTVLAAVYDGSNVFRSWNMDNFSLLCETHIPDSSLHKDKSIVIADSSCGEKVLHAFRSGHFATSRNARTGQMLKNMECQDKTSSIVALAVSSEYFILCCRQQSLTSNEIHTLELFDVEKSTYIRSIKGCAQDNIKHLTTNLVGSHAIAISPNFRHKTSDVAVFNLETEEHKHMALHPGVSTMCACVDFHYCATAAAGDCSVKLWNLSPTINQPAPKRKKQFGLSDIWPMIDNPRYVLAKAVNNGPISVWNVTKGKCLQSAVRIERGLTEGSDSLVVRNTRLVILTDRGLSNVSDDPVQVFRTVLVYDLKMKKYIKKLTGCYIVPAASQEYTLLDNDTLLGPSENRSHFIIWNLLTGHAVFRIKTLFKQLDKTRQGRGMQLVNVPNAARETSSLMTPWDKRTESKSAMCRRQDKKTEAEKRRLQELKRERNNVIDQFLVSGDQKIIVASFYAHYMCVFDVQSHTHTRTLQTDYSMLFLHTSALTFDGSHLVHANYDEVSKFSYVTLWDCTTGKIKRRLKNETNVIALAITDDAQRVVIGRAPNHLHIWDPMKSNSLRRVRGYEGLQFQISSKIFLTENGEKAIVVTGDISVWDLTKRTLLAVFTPDSQISVCNVVLNGRLILFGMYDRPEVIVLKLSSNTIVPVEDTGGVELFGETTGDTSDEEDDEKNDKNNE